MAKLKAAREKCIMEDENEINNEDNQAKSPIEKKKSKKSIDSDKVKFVIANNNEDGDISIDESEKGNEKDIKCEKVSTRKVTKNKKKKKKKHNKDEKEESLIKENEKELSKKKVKKAKADDDSIHATEEKEKIVKKKKLIEGHNDDDNDAEFRKKKKRKIKKDEV